MGRFGQPEFYLGSALLIAAVCYFKGRKETEAATRERLAQYKTSALFVVFSILSAGAVVNIAKFILGRERPRGLFRDGTYGFEMFNFDFGMNSFPSGHSQMVFSLAIALWIIYPRYRVAYFLFAAAIAASRFLGSVHYISDVVMGTYVGIVVPLLLKSHFYDRKGIGLRLTHPPGSAPGPASPPT